MSLHYERSTWTEHQPEISTELVDSELSSACRLAHSGSVFEAPVRIGQVHGLYVWRNVHYSFIQPYPALTDFG